MDKEPKENSQDNQFFLCDCYPDHCTNGDNCWCEPTIEILEDGSKLIIHNEVH